MPTYQFICESCGELEEFTQSIHDDLPTACPSCGEAESSQFHQIYDGENFVFCRGEPTTVGQQAEVNAKRVGKEQMAQMAEQYDVSSRKGRETMKLPKGAKRLKEGTKYKRPWWRDTDKPLDVTKIRDTKKFILEGKKE